jgi:hypothetical protein
MASEVSLWGTFSVADHLRQRPFVADVLLYDQLVVPVPDGDEERARWRMIGRDPDLQAELLEIIGADLSLPVKWTKSRHDEWADRVGVAPNAERDADEEAEAAIRDEVAKAVQFDVTNVEQVRRDAATWTGQGAGDPDDPGYLMTRMILTDLGGLAQDQALVRRLPRIDEVETVVAYGSYSDFRKDRGDLTDDVPPGSEPVFTFQWQFFVPEDSRLSDQELLRKAVELAHQDEIPAWRTALQRWRRNSLIKGQSDDEAQRDMEALTAEYAEAARKLKLATAVRTGVAVVVAVGGAAALAFPPAGLTAVFGLATLKSPKPIPNRLEAAAIFHEARKRFR